MVNWRSAGVGRRAGMGRSAGMGRRAGMGRVQEVGNKMGMVGRQMRWGQTLTINPLVLCSFWLAKLPTTF